MSLFQWGNFTLHSGGQSRFLIDCEALTDEDVAALARQARSLLGPYGTVEGVWRGGIRFAHALQKFALPGGPLLIADDVLTTGASMEEQRRDRPAKGIVIFARSDPPWWVDAVFRA